MSSVNVEKENVERAVVFIEPKAAEIQKMKTVKIIF